MNIDSSEPLPVPPSLAAIEPVHIPPYGPLLPGRAVAAAFGVKPATVRSRRSKGTFPAAAYATPTQSYYRLSDLVPCYYQHRPGEMPDPPLEEMGAFLAAGGREREEAFPGAAEGAPMRSGPFLAAEVQRAIAEVVSESVRKGLAETGQNAAVVEALAAEIAAQREEIDRLKAEALQGRSRSFWERLLGR